MAIGYPSEGTYANVVWEQEDNERNKEKYGVAFEDIQSGFAQPHVRVVVGGPNDFIALIKVQGMIFEVRCSFDLQLTIFAADIATQDAQETYHKSISDSG
ncbi:hypothetical protein [Hyphomonas adhaerens]|uniref:hypothetical protein n=1 Tax=Hyphomonas adhaerens TaxID=81029 RepID=UPI002352C7D2|nr:hypothetical protein [Hyphomonas adhaerens]|tara:strand:+ start:102 stop:401 length:300 start_codon:yes stop_codon:yes gene_type:complete